MLINIAQQQPLHRTLLLIVIVMMQYTQCTSYFKYCRDAFIYNRHASLYAYRRSLVTVSSKIDSCRDTSNDKRHRSTHTTVKPFDTLLQILLYDHSNGKVKSWSPVVLNVVSIPTITDFSLNASENQSIVFDLKAGPKHLKETEINRAANLLEFDINDISDDEIRYGLAKAKGKSSRLNLFLAGRVALRRSLTSAASFLNDSKKEMMNKVNLPILSNESGAPNVPASSVGSISHKDLLAAAAASIYDKRGTNEAELAFSVGVDIERAWMPAATKLQRRLLSSQEQAHLAEKYQTMLNGNTDNISLQLQREMERLMEEEVLLRFSFKEAVFKAVHPYLQRHVDFKEVEIFPEEEEKELCDFVDTCRHPTLEIIASGTASLNFQIKTKETFNYYAKWLKLRRIKKDILDGNYSENGDDCFWLTCVSTWNPHMK